MSGTVLLVDDVSTSRIILKVKLSAAYYDVDQAADLEEARQCIARRAPDLILLRARLAQPDMAACLRRLRADHGGIDIPVILLAEDPGNAIRIKGLQAGFEDVITCPAQERFLLARLRSLLRQRHQSQDLRKHSIAARALGFAERQNAFARNAAITLVTDDPAWGARLRGTLGHHIPHSIRALGADTLMGPNQRTRQQSAPPDLFIVDLRNMAREDGVRLIADLRALIGVPDHPILPILAGGTLDLAATLLDMGVSDVAFDDSDPVEVALRITDQLNRKWAGDQMRDQIKDGLQAAVTDPLTGLYNRRYALSFLNSLLARNNGYDNHFAVMVADLDHFKLINDTFGHAVGDRVLTRVADTLRTHLGPDNLVARIGGEEFLIILPDTSGDDAQRCARMLCEAVESVALRAPESGAEVRITISIGVTVAKRSQAPGFRCERAAARLLEQADRALYRSKAEGRNTVRLSPRSAA